MHYPIRLISRTGVLGVALVVVGCAHVKQEQFDAEIAAVRQEMRAGDEAIERRVGDLDSRVTGLEDRLTALESELTALENEFDMTVERLETAIRFNAPVYFAFDDASIRPQDRPVLERFASVVAEFYPSTLVTVEGFTDAAGSAAYNKRLAQRRADAVRAFLTTEGGLTAEMVNAVGYGEQPERQIVKNERGPGETGWQNRRVVMVIDHGDPTGARGLVASSRN